MRGRGRRGVDRGLGGRREDAGVVPFLLEPENLKKKMERRCRQCGVPTSMSPSYCNEHLRWVYVREDGRLCARQFLPKGRFAVRDDAGLCLATGSNPNVYLYHVPEVGSYWLASRAIEAHEPLVSCVNLVNSDVFFAKSSTTDFNASSCSRAALTAASI